MTRAEFRKYLEGQVEKILAISEEKGHDYIQGTDDEFRNFRVHAGELGLSPYQVWAVYASKHWDAIITFCKEGDTKSEPIAGRIHDEIVYLLLLGGMIEEGQQFGTFAEESTSPALRQILEGFRGHAINADTVARAQGMVEAAGFKGRVGVDSNNTLTYREEL